MFASGSVGFGASDVGDHWGRRYKESPFRFRVQGFTF